MHKFEGDWWFMEFNATFNKCFSYIVKFEGITKKIKIKNDTLAITNEKW
jgi:hypothetical protein